MKDVIPIGVQNALFRMSVARERTCYLITVVQCKIMIELSRFNSILCHYLVVT